MSRQESTGSADPTGAIVSTDDIAGDSAEVLRVLAFCRVNEEFVFGPDEDDYFGSGWNGLLVTQDLEDETASLEEQADNPVTILQASEIERDLERILLEIL
ncbi:hypothetical protein [Natronorubrum sp. DTA7]|uniref:hypothetical protein n=1 Tax=Natronorubrum sp. DTA7 TaxID=3447016 RepID=UPI003F85918B